MNSKKAKKIRQELRKLKLDPTKGAGLFMYMESKKRYKQLNKFERANV